MPNTGEIFQALEKLSEKYKKANESFEGREEFETYMPFIDLGSAIRELRAKFFDYDIQQEQNFTTLMKSIEYLSKKMNDGEMEVQMLTENNSKLATSLEQAKLIHKRHVEAIDLRLEKLIGPGKPPLKCAPRFSPSKRKNLREVDAQVVRTGFVSKSSKIVSQYKAEEVTFRPQLTISRNLKKKPVSTQELMKEIDDFLGKSSESISASNSKNQTEIARGVIEKSNDIMPETGVEKCHSGAGTEGETANNATFSGQKFNELDPENNFQGDTKVDSLFTEEKTDV